MFDVSMDDREQLEDKINKNEESKERGAFEKDKEETKTQKEKEEEQCLENETKEEEGREEVLIDGKVEKNKKAQNFTFVFIIPWGISIESSNAKSILGSKSSDFFSQVFLGIFTPLNSFALNSTLRITGSVLVFFIYSPTFPKFFSIPFTPPPFFSLSIFGITLFPLFGDTALEILSFTGTCEDGTPIYFFGFAKNFLIFPSNSIFNILGQFVCADSLFAYTGPLESLLSKTFAAGTKGLLPKSNFALIKFGTTSP